ncbi:MAG: hypothetical protein LBF01_05295, partial [Bacteroidales bacterium]|nr:hypothetical protein [Bacteroidales bacterium]
MKKITTFLISAVFMLVCIPVKGAEPIIINSTTNWSETFESYTAGALPTGWDTLHIAGNKKDWKVAGATSNKYMECAYSGLVPFGDIDRLFTPVFNLSGCFGLKTIFQFKHYEQQYSAPDDRVDSLILYYQIGNN